MISSYWITVIHFALVNGLLGLSVYLPVTAGQLSLGSGGFAALGGYTSALLVLKFGWPLPAAWLLAGGAAAAAAVLVGYPALRLRGLYLTIATLGFGEVVRVALTNWTYAGGALGLKNIPSHAILLRRWLQARLAAPPLGLSFSQAANALATLLTMLVLAAAVWFCLRLRRTKTGRAFAAIRDDEVAAAGQGINLARYKLQAFALGAFVAGVAGALAAHLVGVVGPGDYGFSRSVEMLLYVVLGGMGVPWGPVLGAALVGVLLESLRELSVFGHPLADWRLVVYGALMVLAIAVRPQGILAPAGRRARPSA